MRLFRYIVVGFAILLVFSGISPAKASVSEIQIEVKEFTLENGMQFLIVERPATPQVAIRLAIRAGSALESAGKTGIAHLLEHMMFKGTKNFGTLDYQKDQELQERIEAAYQIVLRERQKRNPDLNLITQKLAEMDSLRMEVKKIFVPQAFSAQLGKNGAVNVNAFTTKDQTQYIMSVPSDMIEQWFSMASEQLFEPSWREFYVEKEVVQREWAFRYINNPNGAAWLDLEATAYHAHPYRNPVIGWKADMEKYSTRDAMAFHSTYYNPANAVAVLVGDITLADAKRLAQIYFERYPTGIRAPETVTADPPQEGPRKSIRFLKGARSPLVRIGFHAARMGTDDFYALDAMTMILGQGLSARMNQNIVNRGVAVEAWAANPDNRYGGMVVLGGSPNEPEGLSSLTDEAKRQAYLKACEELEVLLLAEIEKIKTEPVSRRELDRIIKLNRREFLDRLSSNESLAGTLASFEVEVGWRYLTTYLDKISEITPADIQQEARKYIHSENQTSIYVLPGGDPDQAPAEYAEMRSLGSAAASGVAPARSSENHSRYPTPAGWKHPLSFERHPEKIKYPPAETTTVEGAKIFYLPDHELPLVNLTLLIKAGEVDIADSTFGLDDLINQSIVRGGTEAYSPAELALILDENAIRISVSVRQEDTVVNLSVMKPDWQKGVSILAEILARPRFDADILNAFKQRTLMGLARQSENARAVSQREGTIWHFKGHRYGRDPLMALKTIPAITRADLKNFIHDYFVPANMTAAVSGDITKAEAVAGLEALFRELPRTKAPLRNIGEPTDTPPTLTLIHKPGQVQSQVNLTLSSIKRSHPDFWKMNLLMSIFGGSDSLMYTRLRDDLGLVYSAYFYQSFKWQAGFLTGYIGGKSDQTGEAIMETLDIMKSLQNEIPEPDFRQKRLDALNSFVFNVDTPAALVTTYGSYHLRNEPLDTLDRIQEAFIHADREELKGLAAAFLNPEKIQITVVADKTTRVKKVDGTAVTLEEDLKSLAKTLGLPFREIELR
ncbi:MAG: pitrilysin family protein [Desulfobacterales bacterium]|nr:pitrilysin family protein [Desulfobacterales bacterium]